MTDSSAVDRPQERSAQWRGRAVPRTVTALISVGFLVAFHFALQHGESVEAVRRRGLQTFAVRTVIREAVHRPSGDGFFPAWDPRPGVLFYDRSQVNRFFTIGLRFNGSLHNQEDSVLMAANLVDNRLGYLLEDMPDESDYFYLPYAVRNEAEGLALLDAYLDAVTSGEPLTENLPAPAGLGTGGTDTFHRLHRTIQQDLKEAYRELPEDNFLREHFPVLLERPGDSDGGWVIFFDRDPVWMEYPGEFPMTEQFVEALTALEARLQAASE